MTGKLLGSFLALLLLGFPAWAQIVSVTTTPVIQLQTALRLTGTVERGSEGALWLRTPEGTRVLLGNNLSYYDAANSPLGYASLRPGSLVTAEFPPGPSRVVAVGADTVTLVSSSGVVSQVPVLLLPSTAVSQTTVQVRYPDGTLVMRPLGEAVQLYGAHQAVVVLPDSGLATFITPTGLVTINLMPELTFSDGLTEYGTVQKKAVVQGTQEIYILTSHGDQLAAPVQMVQHGEKAYSDLNIGDRVSMDVPPSTTVRLTEMFGSEAQFKTPDGLLLQLPFKVIPDSTLSRTQVAVRRLGGEVVTMNLLEALRGDQAKAQMILLPGVPGVSYSVGVTGIYEVHVDRP